MNACKEVQRENPRTVIRGCNSQKVGIHWFRISLPYQYLNAVRRFVEIYFGLSSFDERAYNSYDVRYLWTNGVSISYDLSLDKANLVHNGYVSLDIPGHVLDGMEPEDLRMFLFGLRKFGVKATRTDMYYDDYQNIIKLSKLRKIVKENDFSGFRKGQIIQVFKEGRLTHDEVDFGNRGKNGSGKYMRFYDKSLESDNREKRIRCEIELTKKHAEKAYDLLSQTGSVESLVALCGELVVGTINFVHRTGEKNIGRLRVYKFWDRIKKNLGSVVIRFPIKHTTIGAMFNFIEKQAIRTIAVLRGTFISDVDFLNWQFARLAEAELCLSQYQRNLIKEHRRSTRFSDGLIFDND